jgi:DNA-directed RNA polymerase subunit RPC12/RpoP
MIDIDTIVENHAHHALMDTADYRCLDQECGEIFEVPGIFQYGTWEPYDSLKQECPYCGSMDTEEY